MLPTFNLPPVGPKQGKVWGDTQLAWAWNNTEAHVIAVKAGGFCSRHSHQHKWNRFFVLRGELAVRIFHEGDEHDTTIIRAGQVSDVPPGVRHEFEALEDTLAVEFYWTTLEAGDIERFGTHGGMRERKS
jgi:mannose-6-phosphate isomerase-like protein (cupin superfamily)